MALPRALPTTPGNTNHVGPFISSGGAAYFAVRGNVVLDVYKSADPSTTAFSGQDASNHPSVSGGNIRGAATDAFDVRQVGDVLHVTVLSHTVPAMGDWEVYWDYFTFSMSSDSWDTSTVDSSVNSTAFAWNGTDVTTGEIAIMVRGNDGDIVIVGGGTADTAKGTDYSTIYHAFFNGSTWSTPTRIDTATSQVDFSRPALSNDYTTDGDYVAAWKSGASGEADGRAVTGASHTHETVGAIGSTSPSGFKTPSTDVLVYNDGGTWRGSILRGVGTATQIDAFRFDPTSSTPFASETAESDITGTDVPRVAGSNNENIWVRQAYDPATDTRYCIYVVDATPDSIKYVSSVSEATWGSATTHSSPANDTRLPWPHATVGTSPSDGSSTVIAFLYQDATGATGYYDEIVISAAGGSQSVTPSAASLTLTGGAPVVDYGAVPSAAAPAFTGGTPVVDYGATPSTGSLALTAGTPTESHTQNVFVTALAASLVLTAGAITWEYTTTPSSASLDLTGGAVTWDISTAPSSGALSLTGGTPTVVATQSYTPSTGSLTLTGGAVSWDYTSLTSAGSLSLTGGVVTWEYTTTPSAASLLLTGGTPTVFAAQVLTPSAGSLTLTGGTPTVRRFWGWEGKNAESVIAVAFSATTQSVGGGGLLNVGSAMRVTHLVYNWNSDSNGAARLGLYRNSSLTMDNAELIYDHGKVSVVPGINKYTIATPPTVRDGEYLWIVTKSDEVIVRIKLSTSGARQDIDSRSIATTTESPDGDDPWDDPAPVSWTENANVVAVGVFYDFAASVTPSTASLTLTGGTPLQGSNYVTAPSTASLTLTGGVPVVDYKSLPAAGSITLTGGTPTVTSAGDTSVQPTAASLTLTAGSVAWDNAGTPSSGAPTLTGGVVTNTVTYTPSAGALSLAGGSVAWDNSGTPSTATLTLTGGTPLQGQNYVLTPSAAAISLSGGLVLQGINYVLTPSVSALTLTGGTVTWDNSLTVTAGTLSLTGGTPGVSYTTTATPSATSLTLTGGSVSIVSSEVAATPSAGALSFTGGSTFWWIDQNTGSAVWTDQTTGASVWTDQTTGDATWTDQ